MEYNFTSVQRQSVVGILVLVLKIVVKFFRAIGFLLLIWLFREYEFILEYPIYSLLAVFGIIALCLFSGFMLYRNFVFYIDEEEQAFVLRQGVFRKKQSIVHFKNIEQVNLSQGVIAQALDFYQLEIETSASAKAEITILALDEPKALALKNTLLAYSGKATIPTAQHIATEASDTIKISNARLLLASLFTNYANGLLLAFAFLFTFWSQLDDLFLVGDYEDDIFDYATNQTYDKYLIALLVFLLIPFVINLVRYGVRYFRYQIGMKREGELHLEYGLTNLQNRIIKTGKVQQIDIQENFILKKIGIVFLWLKQISVLDGKKNQGMIHMPGLTKPEAEVILTQWQEQATKIKETAAVYRPHRRKILMRMIQRSLLLLPIGAVLLYNQADLPMVVWGIYALVSLLMYSVPALAYRNERLYITDGFILHQYGIWEITQSIMPMYKVQRVTYGQKAWHKKHGLSSLVIANAAGSIDLHVYDITVIKALRDHLLYQVSAQPKDWLS